MGNSGSDQQHYVDQDPTRKQIDNQLIDFFNKQGVSVNKDTPADNKTSSIPLNTCPHCHSKLDPLDQKMGHCFRCGKRTGTEPSEDKDPGDSTGKFDVRI